MTVAAMPLASLIAKSFQMRYRAPAKTAGRLEPVGSLPDARDTPAPVGPDGDYVVAHLGPMTLVTLRLCCAHDGVCEDELIARAIADYAARTIGLAGLADVDEAARAPP